MFIGLLYNTVGMCTIKPYSIRRVRPYFHHHHSIVQTSHKECFDNRWEAFPVSTVYLFLLPPTYQVWYGIFSFFFVTCRRLIHLDYRRSILFKSPCAAFAAASFFLNFYIWVFTATSNFCRAILKFSNRGR